MLDIERIVSAAVTAPSGDNCQPWRFSWDGAVLNIYHDFERGQHAMNWELNASLISFGCVLELIRIAALEQGYEANIHRLGHSTLDTQPWAAVEFTVTPCQKDPLYNVIFKRCTDRRLFQRGSLNDPVFTKLAKEQEQFQQVHLHVVDDINKELRRHILTCENYVWDHLRATRDFLRWVRLSKASCQKSRDGMHWKNLGIASIDFLSLAIVKFIPSIILPMRGMARMKARSLAKRQLNSSRQLACLSIDNPTPDRLVEAGSFGLRVWLHLNDSGYGVQPLTIMSMGPGSQRMGVLPEWTKKKYRDLFAHGQNVLSAAFHFSPSRAPIWAFRIGRTSPLPDEMRTQRLAPAQSFINKSATKAS